MAEEQQRRGLGYAAAAGAGAMGGAALNATGGIVKRVMPGGMAILLFIYLIFHYFVDFLAFDFRPSMPRLALNLLFVVVFASALLDGHVKSRTILFVFLITALMTVFTEYFLQIVPFDLPFAMPEFYISIVFIIVFNIFSKQLNVSPGIITTFLLNLYFVPFMSQVLFFVPLDLGASSFVVVGLRDFITPLFFPLWFIYVVFFQEYRLSSGWTVIFGVLYIIFLTSSLLIANVDRGILNENPSGLTNSQQAVFYERLANFLDLMSRLFSPSSLFQLYTDTSNEVQAEINRAGGNFESDVEAGATTNVGLSMSEIEKSSSKYKTNQDIILSSKVEARTLDRQITAVFYCTAQHRRGGFTRDGDLSPRNVNIETFLSQNVFCTFPAGGLSADKSYKVTMGTKFDFTASAFIQKYFVRSDLLTQIGQGDMTFEEAFYQAYGIASPNTESIQTRGPAMLALDIASDVIPIGEQNVNDLILQVAIDNDRRWDGKLDKLYSILISVPQGFSIRQKSNGDLDCSSDIVGDYNFTLLDEASCDAGFSTYTDLDCDTYKQVLFNSDQSFTFNENEYQQRVTLTCRIAPSNLREILNDLPFSTQSFRARTHFSYDIQKETSFIVDPADGLDPVANNPSTVNRKFCGQTKQYSLILDDDLFFDYNLDQKNKFEEIYNRFKDKPGNGMTLEDAQWLTNHDDSQNCVERSLLNAILLSDWTTVKNFQNFGGVYFGYWQITDDMMQSVLTHNPDSLSSDILNYNDRNETEKRRVLQENSFDIARGYATFVKNACGATPEMKNYQLECMAGKFKCGRNFLYDNYNTCDSRSYCQYCMDTVVPQVVTYATQVSYYSDKQEYAGVSS